MVMVGFRRKTLSMASTLEDQISKGKQMNMNAEGVDDSTEGASALSPDSYTLKSQELSKGKQVDINAEGAEDSTEGAPALSRDSYTPKLQELSEGKQMNINAEGVDLTEACTHQYWFT